MKKLYIIIFCFFVMFLFSGCNKIPITINQKPDNSYYSDKLRNNFKSEGLESATAFEINYSKEINVEKTDAEIINKFLSNVEKDSYISKPSDLPDKSKYKLFVTFKNNEKFVLEVFDEKYVAVYPWDGDYSPDYIDMSNVHTLYNLDGLCKYLFPKI